MRINEAMVKRIKETYKPGMRVRLLKMDDNRANQYGKAPAPSRCRGIFYVRGTYTGSAEHAAKLNMYPGPYT